MSKNLPPPPKAKKELPPTLTDAEAKLEFVRIVKLLNGRVNDFDLSLIVDYANTHAEIIELRDAIRIEGRTLTGPKGGEYINPTYNLLISRQSHLAALRRDLFFTPRSRGEKAKPQGAASKTLFQAIKDGDEE